MCAGRSHPTGFMIRSRGYAKRTSGRVDGMKRSSAYALVLVLFVAACASMGKVEVTQSILVQTPDADGAACVLSNASGEWEVTSTPEMVEVNRSPDTLYVRCLKPGFASAAVTVEATTRGMPWQNLLSGGFFGAGAKDSWETAFEYPSLISLTMPAKSLGTTAGPRPETAQPPLAEDQEGVETEDSRTQIRVADPPFPMPPRMPAPELVAKSPHAGPVVRVKGPPEPAARFRKKPGLGPKLLATRIGKHEGFIRIVLDLTDKSEFTSGFDRDGKVVIRLPNVSAKPGTRRVATSYLPVVSLVTTSLAEGGTAIAVETRAPVSVKSFDLEPDRIGGHRIIVDLHPVDPRG